MQGTLVLKIIGAPNTKTQVMIERMDAEMPLAESGVLQEMIVYIEDTINKTNGYFNP